MQGVSTRKVRAITEELCGRSFSASTISRINAQLDESLSRFAALRLEEPYPYPILDARCERVRESGVIRSGGGAHRHRHQRRGLSLLCSALRPPRESATSWRESLAGLREGGLAGVELVGSDDQPARARAWPRSCPRPLGSVRLQLGPRASESQSWYYEHMRTLRHALVPRQRGMRPSCKKQSGRAYPAYHDEAGFSAGAHDYAVSPRHCGPPQDWDGHARITGPCGDTMECWVSLQGNAVERVSFTTDGCAGSRVCGSIAVELSEGRRIDDVMTLEEAEILGALTGMPTESEHCAAFDTSGCHHGASSLRGMFTGSGRDVCT